MTLLPTPSSPLRELAPFASIQLVALDIDGTLATAQGQEVAHLIREAVKTLAHYGVTVIVATGRALEGARDTILGLGSRLGPAIVYNGAVTVDLRRHLLISRVEIPRHTVRKIREATVARSSSMWAYDCVSDLIGSDSPSPLRIAESVQAWAETRGPDTELNGLRVEWNPSLDSRTDGAVAVLIAKGEGDFDSLLYDLRQLSDISMTSSTQKYIEIRPRGATKASALELLSRTYGLEPGNVLAVGDNHNDIEMFEWAGVSVAVANATDAARKSASFVATGADARGVLDALRLVISAKRFARGYALDSRATK